MSTTQTEPFADTVVVGVDEADPENLLDDLMVRSAWFNVKNLTTVEEVKGMLTLYPSRTAEQTLALWQEHRA